MRTIKATNLTPGTWFDGRQTRPPVGVKVLCCNAQRDVWFDQVSSVSGTWANPISTGHFAWQVIAQPTPLFFDL